VVSHISRRTSEMPGIFPPHECFPCPNIRKPWKGFARLFRPTYAFANVGHPSGFFWFCDFVFLSVTDARRYVFGITNRQETRGEFGGLPHLAKNERHMGDPRFSFRTKGSGQISRPRDQTGFVWSPGPVCSRPRRTPLPRWGATCSLALRWRLVLLD
jgi:hypothetical protein